MKHVAILMGLILPQALWAGPTDAHLHWAAVTQNTDNTPAVITGYRVYRGLSASALTVIATVSASKLDYVDLPPAGVNYYAVTALEGSVQSALSETVSKRIRLPAPKGGVILPAPKGGLVLPPQ